MTKEAFDKIVEGLNEALAVVKSDEHVSLIEKLGELAKKNNRAYRTALREFRRQFTLKAPE